ncbi:MAG: putative bifunctional diguanylate cyclase/phosphodiesterase [Solirubrobacteraceae bacterium]
MVIAPGGDPLLVLTDPLTGSAPAVIPARVSDVQTRLSEPEETLRAIRNGEVDALVVRDASPAAQVFTLSGADRPYRMFVESMRDGAATVSGSGIILYANRRLADLLSCPLSQIMGSPIISFIASGDHAALRGISGAAGADGGTIEVELAAGDGSGIPVRINTSRLDVDGQQLLCLTFADLTEQNAQKREIARLSQAQADRMRDLELAQAALKEQATHDVLTGLPNRGLIMDRIAQAVALARRLGKSTGLVFVDLDNFKEINDTGGHDAGDAVLCQVGERLLGSVRPMDSVARLGGDEFVVLLPGLEGPEDAVAVAKRIARAFDAPMTLKHGPVTIGASIGISISRPTDRDFGPDRLLRQADTAMYHAKSLGGSRTELFDAANTPTVLQGDREMWIARIRHALDEDRLVLHGQPIIELATGRIARQELLLRMRDSGGQLFPPLAFLPTAEQCGLIYEIDQWVIKQAIRAAARGRSVSVNLSASSVGDPRIFELIERELRDHATDPSRLVFEITETSVMQDMERATAFAERLEALGCKLALDDFGTGFASFTYLKRLPVQYLKIDIDFVRDLARSKRDMFVVKAIVALAADFGQDTIAEGVEDEATAGILRDLGVTFAQGYLYGRPAPLPDNTAQEALLANREAHWPARRA